MCVDGGGGAGVVGGGDIVTVVVLVEEGGFGTHGRRAASNGFELGVLLDHELSRLFAPTLERVAGFRALFVPRVSIALGGFGGFLRRVALGSESLLHRLRDFRRFAFVLVQRILGSFREGVSVHDAYLRRF